MSEQRALLAFPPAIARWALDRHCVFLRSGDRHLVTVGEFDIEMSADTGLEAGFHPPGQGVKTLARRLGPGTFKRNPGSPGIPKSRREVFERLLPSVVACRPVTPQPLLQRLEPFGRPAHFCVRRLLRQAVRQARQSELAAAAGFRARAIEAALEIIELLAAKCENAVALRKRA